MNAALITGSGGLIGGEAAAFFADKFDLIIGIDNDLRKYFFGQEASTRWNVCRLSEKFSNYKHYAADIRDYHAMETIYSEFASDIKLIIHAAAQPSHDWAACEPLTDFTVNATGTLNLLELARQYCPQAVFIFISTSKVYGDTPNRLPFVEMDTRWELEERHPYFKEGIDEAMSIDQSMHSLFGASKAAADVIAQEYGRYFGMKVGVFRAGCLTGPHHSAAQQHGFLAYLMRCAITGQPYTIFGYKGKQVRDNIHSYDFVSMFWHFFQNPRHGEVYNAGGGRFSNCSVLEAIALCEKITGNKMNYRYQHQPRSGDHIWYISNTAKFKSHYPAWNRKYNLNDTLVQMYENIKSRC